MAEEASRPPEVNAAQVDKKAEGKGAPPRGGTGRGISFRDLGRAIGYMTHYRKQTFFAYGAMLISLGAMLLVPQMIQNILDAVTSGYVAQQIANAPAAMQDALIQQAGLRAAEVANAAAEPLSPILWSVAFIIVFAIARAFFSFLQTFMGETVGQMVAFDMRNALFAKIQRLSFSYHDKNRTGQLMIRATDDVEKVRIFIGQGMIMAVAAVVLLTGALVLLFVTNVRLTLYLLPILPLAVIAFMFFGAITQPLFIKVQRKLSAMNTILQESLQGIRVVKAYAREPYEEARFDFAAGEVMTQNISVARIMSFLFPLIFAIATLGQLMILYFGSRQIIFGELTVGEWQKFSLYLAYVFFPLGQLGLIISQMSQASASANRVFEILDAKNEVTDKPGAIALPAVQGNVHFNHVSFSYFGGGDPVLSDLSFEALPGETVAVLGATGSGKSSIINLIPRFYDVTSGAVRIDGHDVRDVQIESLRRQIGIVLQETNLFTGSIRDNIAFGKPNATDAEVQAAAEAAAAHEFIVTFPDGYDTSVGERGSTLSGGQKQRIAIARALLLNPRILILDDSTSSVDVRTETLIQHALDRLMQGRTSFVIAQRISTVVNADKILVLDKGRLAAIGTHEELMESSEIYTEIYRSQLVEDAAPAGADDSAAPLAPEKPVNGAYTNGAAVAGELSASTAAQS
jgi:ATP-binding cassette subfamily B protein